jgi:NADPH-ferrihemoprotein reductase
VCPFRGFLQQRQHMLAAAQPGAPRGPAWLYFGCRSAHEDYLYRADLEGFQKAGTLEQLRCAFSREGPTKVYVQHLVQQDGEQLAQLMQQGAHVFVCGDGAHMAKDVHATLLAVLQEHGGVSAADAEAQLAQMSKEGRYVRDIWS